MLEDAQEKINSGEYEGAIQDLTEFLSREPGHAFALRLRAVAYLRLKELDLARVDLEASLAAEPRDARTHYNAGLVAEMSGQPDRALEFYEDSVRLDDAYVLPIRGRADLRFARGDFEGALRDYARLVELGADDSVLLRRGVSYYKLRRIPEALADYDAFLARSPDHAIAHYNRGLAREEAGDAAAALSDYERAVELDPSDLDAARRRDALRKPRRAPPKEESGPDPWFVRMPWPFRIVGSLAGLGVSGGLFYSSYLCIRYAIHVLQGKEDGFVKFPVILGLALGILGFAAGLVSLGILAGASQKGPVPGARRAGKR